MKAGVASLLIVFSVLVGPASRIAEAESTQPQFAVLVFSKTTGFRHDSIPDGIAAIKTLGADHGFSVDNTEDAARFTDAELARYKVVVFLSTTGDILDDGQKAAFERYIRSGGGFAGIHSASDTEYQWAWYGRLVGAYFASHPEIQRATVRIEDLGHASTEGLPHMWERTDEWYNFRSNPHGAVHVLATLDEATYSGGRMGADHPIAWCQMIDGGRSWYTAMGHTKESYAEPLFRLHLLGGIESVAGVAAGCAAGERGRPQRLGEFGRSQSLSPLPCRSGKLREKIFSRLALNQKVSSDQNLARDFPVETKARQGKRQGNPTNRRIAVWRRRSHCYHIN